jgi:hypothetical protein
MQISAITKRLFEMALLKSKQKKCILILMMPVGAFLVEYILYERATKSVDKAFYLALKNQEGYSLHYEYPKPDTIYAYFPFSLAYQPIKAKLDSLDAKAYQFIEERENILRQKYVPSVDKEKSTYFRMQRLNDSIRLYVRKGDVIRERIQRGQDQYNREVKGVIYNVKISVVHSNDTMSYLESPVWVWFPGGLDEFNRRVEQEVLKRKL